MTAEVLPIPIMKRSADATVGEAIELIAGTRRHLDMLEEQAARGEVELTPEWFIQSRADVDALEAKINEQLSSVSVPS